MAYNVRIKPLVLFDLEDKMKLLEHKTDGKGRKLYQTFLAGISDLQNKICDDTLPVYEEVKKYVSEDELCNLFYTFSNNTILVIGLQ